MGKPGGDDVEIIELLGPATGPAAFAPATGAAPSTPSRPRVPRSAALLALVAVVGAVALVVALTDPGSAPRVAHPPTTVAAPFSPSTTAASVPGRTTPTTRLIADRPAGFVADSAADTSATASTVAATSSVSALWATGVDATAGNPWFLVQVSADVPTTSVGDERVDTPLGVAVVTSEGGGRLDVTGPIDGGYASIRSGDLAIDDAVSLLSAVRLGDGHLVYDQRFIPPAFYLVASSERDEDGRLEAPQLSSVHYVSVPLDAGAPTYTATTSAVLTTFQHVVEWFFLLDAENVTVDGGPAALGTSIAGGSPQRTLVFEHDGVHVTLAGDVDPAVLIVAAQSIRAATDREWSDLTRRAVLGEQMSGIPQQTVAIGSGSFGDGSRWDVLAQNHPEYPDLFDPQLRVSRTVTSPGGSNGVEADVIDIDLPPVRPAVGVVATTAGTVFVAVAPPGTVGAVLRVTIGSVTIDAPVRPTPTRGNAVDQDVSAATARSETGAYTAQLVAADGTVLSSVSSPIAEPSRMAALP